ncbi:hypothetical protein THAOC_34031 [Thalassiosira oceanica]|uniref:Uncharacterized protein n=1 Tax=Thalassiosira oceanica TaxID=159749 RepID=K0RDZ4_THAOC|nr:hypothetical protein THAOC_34031 [Thalassiosira oceanica]|eukprot:EJK47261.1 hypothetical protein THAOC_34031 [Thalassiosira oceanica]
MEARRTNTGASCVGPGPLVLACPGEACLTAVVPFHLLGLTFGLRGWWRQWNTVGGKGRYAKCRRQATIAGRLSAATNKFSQQVVLAAPNAMGHMNNATRNSSSQSHGSSASRTSYPGLLWQEWSSGRRICVKPVLRVPTGWRLQCPPRPGRALDAREGARSLYETVHRLDSTGAGLEDRKYPDGTIVADFVARDCPTPNQASNDSGLGGRSDILGEVKTIQPGKSSYKKGNCQANPPVNQRASNVRWNYRKRTVDPDRAHAPEVVGDGTNGQVGPTIRGGPWTIPHTGNVFLIVAGAFSEVNEDASKLVTNLARLTAKTDFGKSMSPLAATAGKAVPSQE